MIIEYSEPYQQQVGDLIVSIQAQEFGIDINLEDQPDLLAIASFYQQTGGNFWLFLIDGLVVGTISLLKIADDAFALRKMFVHQQFRGQSHNIAAQLLHHAEEWARSQKSCVIYLGTTDRFKAAHRFYEKHGYQTIAMSELPQSFPVMSIDSIFYHKSLSKL